MVFFRYDYTIKMSHIVIVFQNRIIYRSNIAMTIRDILDSFRMFLQYIMSNQYRNLL
jgi:hypothetical protein